MEILAVIAIGLITGILGCWIFADLNAAVDWLAEWMIKRALKKIPHEGLRLKLQSEALADSRDLKSPTRKLISACSLVFATTDLRKYLEVVPVIPAGNASAIDALNLLGRAFDPEKYVKNHVRSLIDDGLRGLRAHDLKIDLEEDANIFYAHWQGKFFGRYDSRSGEKINP